jgi:alpha-glucosidase
LLLTLRGTPFLYYGEEIGMQDVRLRYRQLRDPYTRRYWPFLRGRDPARTPMQWDGSPQAGFTVGEPWLPLSPDATTTNVAAESSDPTSLLALYRTLIWIRKTSAALSLGTYREVTDGPLSCLVYLREACCTSKERLLVAVNFSRQRHEFSLPSIEAEGVVLLSTDPQFTGRPFDPRRLHLGPDEALLIRLNTIAP